MGGLGHAAAVDGEPEDPRQTVRNARYGLWLFGVYCLIYGTFVVLNAFVPQVMAAAVAGINLAVVYGLGLIVMALVLAVIYVGLCGQPSGSSPATTASSNRPGEEAHR